MNSTSLNSPTLSRYSALPDPGGNPKAITKGTEQAPVGTGRGQRKLDRQNERTKKKAGPERGDALGNAIMTVYRAGEGVASALSSTLNGLLPLAQTDQAEVVRDAEPPTEHPIPNANAALAEASTLNDVLLGDLSYVGEIMGFAFRGFLKTANWQIGPTGASAMPVTESTPDQCALGPDGSYQCPKELKDAPLARPSLSRTSLMDLKKTCKRSFDVHISPSLATRSDQSLSNVLVVISDHDHYHAGMQRLITDTLGVLFESNDKLLVEWAADEPPPPVYCRGVPQFQCTGVDDPVEIRRLLELANKSTDAARSAYNFIAGLASDLAPMSSNDYGVVKAAFSKEYDKVRAGQIKVTGANIKKLQKLVEDLGVADARYQKESRSPNSHQRRNAYMKEALKKQTESLDGHKAIFVVGHAHLIGEEGLVTGLQDAMLDEMDCVILHQTKFKPEDLKSAHW